LLALGPAALNVAILPRFSQLAAAGDWTVLQHSIKKVLGASIAASALVAIALFALSPLIVRLSLERGAFTAADTASVAAVQAISMLQLPFLVGVTVLVRVLSAMKANQVMLPAFTAVLILSTGLSFILMERYRVSGIAMASCIGQAALFSILIGTVFREGRRRFPIQ
jgi:putative peptidoglycan lipid II flippase